MNPLEAEIKRASRLTHYVKTESFFAEDLRNFASGGIRYKYVLTAKDRASADLEKEKSIARAKRYCARVGMRFDEFCLKHDIKL